MSWVCPRSHEALVPAGDRLDCSGCGRSFETIDGIPLFAADEDAAERLKQPSPLLDELWRTMRGQAADEAARRFAESHVRNPFSADWSFFLPDAPAGRVLEVGAGFGDDSAALTGGPQRGVLLVPQLANARVLRRRLAEVEPGDWAIAVLGDGRRLPLADGTVGAIAMEDEAAPGFAIDRRSFPEVAVEWRRVLAPEGTVFIGLRNSLARLPGAARLFALLQSKPQPDSFNRLIKKIASDAPRPRLGLRATIRAMRRAGFGAPTIYAPLPDEKRAEIVIPLENSRAVRYVLHKLIRRNSSSVRAAILAADVAVRLDLFRFLVPYSYLFFRPSSSAGAGT